MFNIRVSYIVSKSFVSKSSLLLTLFLVFKIVHSLWKKWFSKKNGLVVSQNLLMSGATLWSSFLKTILSFAVETDGDLSLVNKTFLGLSFLVFDYVSSFLVLIYWWLLLSALLSWNWNFLTIYYSSFIF